MTVGELRELLVRFDPSMRVVTAGFDEQLRATPSQPSASREPGQP